jgi:hypothetical protein
MQRLAEQNSKKLLSQTVVTDGHLSGDNRTQSTFGGDIFRGAQSTAGGMSRRFSNQQRDRRWDNLNCQRTNAAEVRSVKKLAQSTAKFHNYFWPRARI